MQIPEDVLDRLNEYSSQTRTPKNALTEIALREYLDRVLPVKQSKTSKFPKIK